MSEELKECPFCGAEAILNSYGVNPTVYEIECSDCGCYQKDEEVKQNVIDRWNTRFLER